MSGVDATNGSRPIDELYTKPEVARFFKVSVKTVSRLIEDEELAYVRLGKRGIRITGAALREYIYRAGKPR